MADVRENNMSIGQKLYEDIVIVVSDEKNNKKEVLGEVSKLF